MWTYAYSQFEERADRHNDKFDDMSSKQVHLWKSVATIELH